jgi:hypothetical protein
MDNPTISNGDACTCRLRLVIKALHKLSTSLWKGRSKPPGELRLLRGEDIEIKHYYEHPEMLAPGDRHDCTRPLPSILCSTPSI